MIMAQDYHIYLHGNSSGSNGGGNQTKPFSAKDETSNETIKSIAKQNFGYTKSIATGGATNLGVAALSKVAPWIAAVVIAAKITDKVLTVGFAHQEEYTGNYKNNVMYNNFKSQFSALTNPIKTAFVVIHQQYQFEKQNKAITQQNRLIGNSILKDFNIGV